MLPCCLAKGQPKDRRKSLAGRVFRDCLERFVLLVAIPLKHGWASGLIFFVILHRQAYLARGSFVLMLLGAGWLNDSLRAAPDLPAVDFDRDVQPILSEHCFLCHGPDKQEANLRLDQSGVAERLGFIVPGKPDRSELVARIESDDPGTRMPPEKAKRPLSQADQATLRRWIQDGARYEEHWAFQPIPSTVELRAGVGVMPTSLTPIDDFVEVARQRRGLTGNPRAASATLIRRLHFDLTGLPPEPVEMERAGADTSKASLRELAERWLATPEFGEQMARTWLDLARYADTFGYDNDREMGMWPWRDWVIRAYNQNLPYDEFIRWQVAGDLLGRTDDDPIIATGFNRLHRQNAEGGALPEEFRIAYVADRTETFATAFLGLTVGCARCHDHKFDPISQVEYYALTAFFNHIDEAGVYAEKTGATPTPSLVLYGPGERERHVALKATIEGLERELAMAAEMAGVRFDREAVVPFMNLPKPVLELGFDDDASNLESVESVPGVIGQAVEFSGDRGIERRGVVTFERTEPFSLSAWIRPGSRERREFLAHNSKPNWEVGSRGFEWVWDRGWIEFGLSHFWPGNALRVRSRKQVPMTQWTHVAVTYDGSSQAAGLVLYLDGEQVPVEVIRDGLSRSIAFEGNVPPLLIGAHPSEPGFRNGQMDEFRVDAVCLSPLEVQRLVRKSDAGSLALERRHYIERIDPVVAKRRAALQAAREAEHRFVEGLKSMMIMQERSGTPSAAVLTRGRYDQPTKRVTPAFPAVLGALDRDLPLNRLDLARWLVHPDHPLTARVVANRVWAHFFGRGLVATPDDFGRQGARPTHPALLDYLAASLIESGWDYKSLCRLIIRSATYQQSAAATAEMIAADPANVWLTRGPHRRLEAEAVRDAVLQSCGILTRHVGGPSVKPPQPPGLWRETGPQTFRSDVGAAQYRRSIYTFWKRTAPPPSMLTFDAVSREVCVADRGSTVTPNQALVLLNDPQFVEAARVLAMDCLDEAATDSERVERIVRALLSREPTSMEASELLEALGEQRILFRQDPEGARRFCEIGQWPLATKHDPIDVAAWTAVIQVVMNFHDFQMQ